MTGCQFDKTLAGSLADHQTSFLAIPVTTISVAALILFFLTQSVSAQDETPAQESAAVNQQESLPGEPLKVDAEPDVAAVDLPDAQTILDKYFETTGGREALLSVENRSSRSKIKVTGQQEMIGVVTTIWSEPNLYSSKTSYREQGNFLVGFDGEVHWKGYEESVELQSHALDDETSEILYNQHRLLTPDRFYQSVTVTGTEELDGIECYRVEFITPLNSSHFHYFEIESGRLKALEYTIHLPYEYMIRATYSDFREVEGLGERPFKIMQTYDNIDMVAEVNYISIEYNCELPEETFQPPEIINVNPNGNLVLGERAIQDIELEELFDEPGEQVEIVPLELPADDQAEESGGGG